MPLPQVIAGIDTSDMWDLAAISTDRWRLSNRTGKPAHQILVTFRGTVDGRGWFEKVAIHPSTLATDAATEIHILRSDTVNFVEVSWQEAAGEAQRRTWTPASGEPRLRTAVMPIDGETVLPLQYLHDPAEGRFRSLGYVRVGHLTLTSVDHAAADTTAGRDEFLAQVLASLGIPARRIRRILRKTLHIGS